MMTPSTDPFDDLTRTSVHGTEFADPAVVDPAAVDPAAVDPAVVDPAVVDPAVGEHLVRGGAVPAVSVVVIAYNEQARIADCVASIAAQSYRDTEIIVVDDGSLDATVEVLRRTFATDVRLRVIELGTNQGRGAARLAGLSATRGEHIAFVDADIVLPPTWLQELMTALPGHSAVSGIAVPDGDCAVLWRMFSPTARVKAGSEEITGNNVLFVGSVIREIGFDAQSRLGEDFRLAGRMRAAGHTLATVPGITVEHHEAKTYRKALRWLYESGVDASSLLQEFGRLRMPDLAWMVWLVAHVFLIAGVVVRPSLASLAVLSSFALSTAIAFAHAFSRFDPSRRTGRWLLAAVANIPLMTGYLIGRTVGTTKVIARASRRRSSSATAQQVTNRG